MVPLDCWIAGTAAACGFVLKINGGLWKIDPVQTSHWQPFALPHAKGAKHRRQGANTRLQRTNHTPETGNLCIRGVEQHCMGVANKIAVGVIS